MKKTALLILVSFVFSMHAENSFYETWIEQWGNDLKVAQEKKDFYQGLLNRKHSRSLAKKTKQQIKKIKDLEEAISKVEAEKTKDDAFFDGFAFAMRGCPESQEFISEDDDLDDDLVVLRCAGNITASTLLYYMEEAEPGIFAEDEEGNLKIEVVNSRCPKLEEVLSDGCLRDKLRIALRHSTMLNPVERQQLVVDLLSEGELNHSLLEKAKDAPDWNKFLLQGEASARLLTRSVL